MSQQDASSSQYSQSHPAKFSTRPETKKFVLSQVALARQHPFAMFPMLHFASTRELIGQWRPGWCMLIARWNSALLITACDLFGSPGAIKQAWHVGKGE